MAHGGEPSLNLDDLLHPDEQRQFRRLCIETSAEDLAQLPEVVAMHLDHIKNNAESATDVETAEMIAVSFQGLLSSDADFDAEDRAQIRGAVEYFLLTDDAAGDMDDALGFDDDARVLNAVLRRIGRT
ncbi:MAG: hypothetical protein AAGA65_30840, partial [Actinomycetota bacterium]